MKKKLSLFLSVLMVVLTLITAVPTAAEEAAALADTGELEAPQITSLNCVSVGIDINWNAVSGATSYAVFVKTSSGDWSRLARTTQTHYTYRNVTSGNSYTFTVRCCDVNGNYNSGFNSNGWTTVWYATTKPTTAPTQKPTQAPTVKPTTAPTTAPTEPPLPLGETAIYTAGDTDFDGEITVMDATVIQRVLVHLTADKNGAIAKVGNVDTAGDFDVTDATYIQRVVAGIDVPSSVKVGTKTVSMALPENTKFSAPSVSTSQVSDGVKVSWSYVYYAPMYRVFKKVGNTWNHLGDTSESSFVDKTANKAGTYSYAVRIVSADHQQHLSPFSATSTFTINSTTVNYITPSVYVYDGHPHVSWDKFAGANKYVVSIYLKSNGSDSVIESKTVTGNSIVLDYDFTPPMNRMSYYTGQTFCTTVVAYKNNTILTTPKPVDTTTTKKYLRAADADKFRGTWQYTGDIYFCNVCNEWMPQAYGYGLVGRISPEDADMSAQTYHINYDDCYGTSYRALGGTGYPSGLQDSILDNSGTQHQYFSIVDTNFAEDYFPVISTAPSISSIKKISYTKEMHPEQMNNKLPASEKTDDLPMWQADGALEITFKPVDNDIKTYFIWVKSDNAKSVSKLTTCGMNKWTLDERVDTSDWSVLGKIVITDGKYCCYFFRGSGGTGATCTKEISTNDFSTLTFMLPNYYGNEYNAAWDWTMFDNNANYQFAIQPRLDRKSHVDNWGQWDTVPAAPRGNAKSFTWTGRNYNYYTENNAYFLGATLRASNIKSKVLEVYAEQRNLTIYGDNPWGQFETFAICTDENGKEYLSIPDLMKVPCQNCYRIPVRTNIDHDGRTLTWRGYADHGTDVLSTRGMVYGCHGNHTDGTQLTMTIASHGLYARTSLYEIWSKRNEYGKKITITDNNVPLYDPICYEYGLDGSYTYYYETPTILKNTVIPSDYVPCTPDPNAVRKENDEHLWERYVDPYLRRQYATNWSDYN